MIEIAIKAAKIAGAFLKKNVGNIGHIEEKDDYGKNLVTEMDKGSEQRIMRTILGAFPDHTFLGEETGKTARGTSPYVWIVDPLDGTTNYTHGFPVFCVSIALEINGRIELGVIYDPNFGDLFTAERGKGAFLNGNRIRVSNGKSLKKSLLVTGFPYNINDNPNHAIEHFVNFLKASQAVRRMGSAAIDLAYVAAGRYEGFWEVNLKPWDVAAGILLVTEAGGTVTDFAGGEVDIYGEEILASNGLVHEEMMEVLKQQQPLSNSQ